MPSLFPVVPVIPVISRSPNRAAPRSELLWGKSISKGKVYGDEPLPVIPSEKAPRSAHIIGRIAEDDRVTYTVKIGEEVIEDVRLDEVLDYVSAYDLERFENERFVEEGEALRIARIADEEAERKRAPAKERAKRKDVDIFQSMSDESGEEEKVATGKHGRARPTYTHMFLRPQQRRRRRKRDPATGELMPLSDEEEEVVAPLAAPRQAFVRPPAPEPGEIPKRRRRKRDPITGELLPLDPLPESVLQPARSSPIPKSSPAPMGTEKKRRRKRHPLTGELMPIGWRYNPEAEKDSYQERRDGNLKDRSPNAGSPSMHRLSISQSQEHASKRVKLGSESSWDGLPVEESVRSPSAKVMPRQSMTPVKKNEIIELSDSDDGEDTDPQGQGLLSTFKNTVVPKTSMLNPTAKAVPVAPATSSSGATSREPFTLQSFLSGRDESTTEGSSSASPVKAPVLSPNSQRKTSIMNPVATNAIEEQNMGEDEPEEPEWFVEAILGHRLSDPRTHPGKPQTMLYKVKWEGFDEPTWEPRESFADEETVIAYRKHVGLDSPKKVVPSKPEESSDDEDDGGYVVEAILAHHMSDPRSHPGKPRTMLYKVKWVGYDEPTWEPATSFDDKSLLERYKRKIGLK